MTEKEVAAIVVEILKVKPRHREHDPDPGSWRDVVNRLHQGLKNLVGLLPDLVNLAISTVRGTEGVVRGVARLPEQVGKRIEGVQRRADEVESKTQLAISHAPHDPAQFDSAIENLELVMRALQAKGLAVRLIQDGGRWIISATRPELVEDAAMLGASEVLKLESDAKPDYSKVLLDELKFTDRTTKILKRLGIMTLKQLIFEADQIDEQTSDVGLTTVNELIARFREMGVPIPDHWARAHLRVEALQPREDSDTPPHIKGQQPPPSQLSPPGV